MNDLHTMLQGGFRDALQFIGSTATIGDETDIDIIVSEVNDKIAMELEGYLDDADYVGVVSTADFSAPPVENTKVTGPDGATYLIRGIKTDQSAYVLALKKTSP